LGYASNHAGQLHKQTLPQLTMGGLMGVNLFQKTPNPENWSH